MIKRANIVVAEPMPGEKDLLQAFLAELKEDSLEDLIRRALQIPANRKVRATKAMAESLAELVDTVWEGMKLAGEMGTLLKIERDIAPCHREGPNEWDDSSAAVSRDAIMALAESSAKKRSGWSQASMTTSGRRLRSSVFQALAEYVEAASALGNARRRLFAEDATARLCLG